MHPLTLTRNNHHLLTCGFVWCEGVVLHSFVFPTLEYLQRQWRNKHLIVLSCSFLSHVTEVLTQRTGWQSCLDPSQSWHSSWFYYGLMLRNHLKKQRYEFLHPLSLHTTARIARWQMFSNSKWCSKSLKTLTSEFCLTSSENQHYSV